MKFTIIALLLLGGCVSPPYWVKAEEPLKNVVIQDIDQVPWANVQGWVVRDHKTSTCHVFIRRNTMNRDCTIAHELKHCEGWDHPHDAHSLACMIMPLGRI